MCRCVRVEADDREARSRVLAGERDQVRTDAINPLAPGHPILTIATAPTSTLSTSIFSSSTAARRTRTTGRVVLGPH